jgi:hypothetical protein
MWPRIKKWVEKNEYWIIILALATALRIPSLLEPYWYGDEGIYLTIGNGLNSGLKLYNQIHDNKPPLLYWTAALAGGSQFMFRLLAMAANAVSILVFWKLASKWWGEEKSAIWSTLIFAMLTTLPLLEGNIANAELFFLLPTVSAFFLLYKAHRQSQIFAAGLLFGVAALFKMPALLEISIWPIYWLVSRDKDWFKKSVLLGLGAFVLIGASIVYYYFQGSLSSYLVAAGFQNVPYLSSWQAVSGPIGLLKVRAVILLGLIMVVIFLKNRLGKQMLLLSLWWLVTLFAALLSGRPYPHYLLQMVPAISLGVVYLWQSKSVPRYVGGGLLALLILGFVTFKFYVYPTTGYYVNFLQWSMGQKSTADYYSWFNKSVNRNYRIAQIIIASSSPSDHIFIWGDEPMIYALTRRLPAGKYTAKYHIGDFQAHQQTIEQIKLLLPRYVVTFSNQNELPGLAEILQDGYVLETEIENSQIYRRLGLRARYN